MRLFLKFASLFSSQSLIIGLLASVNAGLFRSFFNKINLAPSGLLKMHFLKTFLNYIFQRTKPVPCKLSTLFII